MTHADAAVWAAGARVPDVPVDQMLETADERDGFAWFDLVDPSEHEVRAAAEELELHHLLVEDVLNRGQRPKLERYGDTAYCVVHRIEHVDGELVSRELHAIIAPRCVITISWGDGDGLARERQRLANGMEGLEPRPEVVLYAILDETVDGHEDLVDDVQQRIAGIEDAFFGERELATVDVYRAMRAVLALQRASDPMSGILERLATRLPEEDLELRRHLRDVDDHARRTSARLTGAQSLLTSMLQLASARVSERQNDEIRAMTEQQIVQNEQMKKVSSWAAIIFAPTLIAGIYGMNFHEMPELHWALGYPFALLLMIGFAGTLYAIFKRKDWL